MNMTKNKLKLERWCWKKFKQWEGNAGFWLDKDDIWINPAGGYHNKSKEDDVLSEFFVKSYQHLQDIPAARKLVKEQFLDAQEDSNYRNFWIAPTGKVHQLQYGAHSQFCRIVLMTTEDAAERLGWAKVTNNVLRHTKKLTNGQRSALRKMNIRDVEDLS